MGVYKKKYVTALVDDWKQQLKILAKIAKTEPQAAYSAFVGGFKGKLTYFMRTIPELDEFLKPIKDTIRNELIPALTGGHICSDNERKLLSLPSRYGGLGIPIFTLCAQQEYVNSRKVTAALSKFIVDQSSTCIVNEPEMKKIKATIKHEREAQYKNLSDEIQLNMSEKLKRLNDLSKEKGVSNWLTAYPILEQATVLGLLTC